MKLTLACIPLAMLASTVAAQGWPSQPGVGNQGYPPYQPGNQGQGGGYQPPPNYGSMQGQPQWPNIPPYEVNDWESCMVSWLNEINASASGSGPVCNLWQCLSTQANKYNKGGLVAAASSVLSPLCVAIGSPLNLVREATHLRFVSAG
jgi:hypothetical protein